MTKDKALSIVYDGILGEKSILVQMRSGDGLDNAIFEKIVKAIEYLTDEYKNSETVPKKLALCFVDISNYFYFNEGHYSEEECNRMEDAAQKISYLAGQLFERSNV